MISTTELQDQLHTLQRQLSEMRLQTLCRRVFPRTTPELERAAALVHSPHYRHEAASAALEEAEALFWRYR